MSAADARLDVAGETLLRVEGLTKHFPVNAGVFGRQVATVNAVDGVSFELAARRTLGLVGESGCGKTTVGECIVRLLEPTSGRIVFDGRDITHAPMAELQELRRDLQIIFQDPFGSLNPRMTVADIVGEAVEVHGLARGLEVEERVFSTLAKVGLPAAWINRYPHEFSGGQRQRISIARAIALDPRLIVCDEAVSALDVSIRAQVINLLIDLQREMDLSYLFISHDLSVVRHIADDVAVMYLGQIVETAPTDELFAQPGHPYARSLLSAIPVIDPALRVERIVLEGDVPTPIDPPPGCRFHTRCPAAFERCAAEEPPVLAVGDAASRHHVKCWHAEALANDPEWFRVVRERTELAIAGRAKTPMPAAPPASRFALATPGEAGAVQAAARSVSGESAASRAAIERNALDMARWRSALGLGGTALGLVAMVFGAPWLGATWATLCFLAAVLPGRTLVAPWVAGFALALALGAMASGAVASWERGREALVQLGLLETEIAELTREGGAAPARLADLGWRLAALAPDASTRQRARIEDPWGGRWQYRSPGSEGRAYDLGSFGPDGRLGGGDDVGHPFEPVDEE